MKCYALPLTALAAPLVAAQFMHLDTDALEEQCSDVCGQPDIALRACDRAYYEDITLEEHISCMCDDNIPKFYECASCGHEAAEGEEAKETWDFYNGTIDLYSEAVCQPSASRFLDEVLSSMMSESYATPTPVETTVVITTPAPTGTPGAEEEEDKEEDEDEEDGTDNVTTGAAPAITQVPFFVAAAGLAFAAAL